MNDNPMTALLHSLRRREPLDLPGTASLLVAALCAGFGLQAGIEVVAWLFPLLLGVTRTVTDVALLAALRRGGCLEELLTARVQPADIVDGLALGSLRQVAVPTLGLCMFLLVLSPFTVLEVIVSTAILTLCLSYVLQWVILVRWRSTPCLVLLFIGFWYWPLFLATLVVVGLATRWLTIAALIEPAPLRTVCVLPAGAPGAVEDPLEMREWRRLRRFPWLLCGVLVSGLFLELDLLMVFAAWLTLIQAARAAMATCGAVVKEREQRTFEVLGLTRLTAEEFVDGWARLAWRPLVWEAAAFTAVVMCASLRNVHLHEAWIAPVAAFGLLATAPIVGAYLGLNASATAPSRGMAVSGALALVVCGSLTLAIALGLVIAGADHPWILLVGGIPGLLVLASRASVLSRLRFGPARGPAAPGPVVCLCLVAAACWVCFANAALPYRPCRCIGQLTACKSNLKNLGTACEMYSTDFSGRYPTKLDQLTPNYLKTIPTCPAAGEVTYTYESAVNPDLYTVICAGSSHAIDGVEGDYPQYTSVQGLIERP